MYLPVLTYDSLVYRVTQQLLLW